MKFFFDNTLSPKIARAMNELVGIDGDVVTHLKEKFPANIKDTEWISRLGDEGNWIVLTNDIHIYSRPHEKAAWEETDLIVLFLAPAWSNENLRSMASRLLKRWDNIKAAVKNANRGTALMVPIRGGILRK